MNVPVVEMPKKEAKERWKTYVGEVQRATTPEDKKIAEDFRACYNQLKSGRKLVDIYLAIQRGGLNEHHQPRLAVAPARAKEIIFKRFNSAWIGGRRTRTISGGQFSTRTVPDAHKEDVMLPEGTFTNWPDAERDQVIKAMVPIIPAPFKPEKLKPSHYLLWEVENWQNVQEQKKEPPYDPWLLERLTENMFVVLACWDLTQLERSIMAGRAF